MTKMSLFLCLAVLTIISSGHAVAQWMDAGCAERTAANSLPGSAVVEAQRLVDEGDRLLKEGREPEATRAYLAAHEKFQQMILHYFELGLRASLGGTPADEDALTAAANEVAGLRNVNLSKLWIVLDPDDRAFEQGLEADRAVLLQCFGEFRRPSSAEPLEQFLHRLYPDDLSGDRQMEAMRGGRLPPSKRWARLGFDAVGTPP